MAFRRATIVALIALALPTPASATIAANCGCKYQGAVIPDSIYGSAQGSGFPQLSPASCTIGTSCTCTNTACPKCGDCDKWPGMYRDMSAIKYYGTSCAAWDALPGTPWFSYCPGNADFSHRNYNWCQQPWCYVDSACADGVASSVFAGSAVAFYSYKSCGVSYDCYTNIALLDNSTRSDQLDNDGQFGGYPWPAGCPYDPTNEKTYRVFKTIGDCACMMHGETVPGGLYLNWPELDPAGCTPTTPGCDKDATNCVDGTGTTAGQNGACKKWPGMYSGQAAIGLYGTTCAAWDQAPGTPWYSYCPANSQWCSYDWNWCQQPWCYVNGTCASGVASSVYKGSPVAFYSYDTCLSAPDCYTNVAWETSPTPPQACPFDQTDNNWWTALTCSDWVAATTTTVAPSNGTTTGNATTTTGASGTTSASGTDTTGSALVAGVVRTGPSMPFIMLILAALFARMRM